MAEKIFDTRKKNIVTAARANGARSQASEVSRAPLFLQRSQAVKESPQAKPHPAADPDRCAYDFSQVSVYPDRLKGNQVPALSSAAGSTCPLISVPLFQEKITKVQDRLETQKIASIVRQEVNSGEQEQEADVGPSELTGPAPANPSQSAGPTPDYDHSGSTTVTINADSAPEFAQKITSTIGSPHVNGVFEPDIQTEFKTDSNGRKIPGTEKIKSIGLKVSTAITKVRFGLGRPNAKHKQAINEMVEAIKEHEEKHRAIYESEAARALTDAQKYVGTGKMKEAQKALTKTLECAANKRHEAIDAQEGLLTAEEQTDGSVRVTKSSSGAKYPCPK